MTRWSARRVFGLVLALLLGLGMAFGNANASAMNSKMMAAADMPMSGGCNGCSDDAAMPACCATACVATAPAILPTSDTAAVVESSDFQPLMFQTGTGQAGPPDPYPPKPSIQA